MELSVQNKAKRIEYLDVAKAIAIIFVILGHTAGNTATYLYREIVYSFHMPLFFVISGLLTKPKEGKYTFISFINFLVKNVIFLLVPYFIWAFIYGKISLNNIGYIFYGSWESLTAAETLTSLWYLTAFFVSRIFVELLMILFSKIKKIDSHILALIAAVIVFTIGFVLPKLEMGYFFCFNVAFVVTGFMLVGYALRWVIDKLFNLK